MVRDKDWLLGSIREIHAAIRETVPAACEASAILTLSEVADDGGGDTIYAIDRISESTLVELFESRIAVQVPIVLIAEGITGGKLTPPRGSNEADAIWRIVADPIEGTHILIYQKRSAWILTGVAPNFGEDTSLNDIVLAVQTELPLIKQHLCDVLWAKRAEGAQAERFNRLTRESVTPPIAPSGATGLARGYGSVTRFFAGGRDILAAIDDDIALAALGHGSEGKAQFFEDSTSRQAVSYTN